MIHVLLLALQESGELRPTPFTPPTGKPRPRAQAHLSCAGSRDRAPSQTPAPPDTQRGGLPGEHGPPARLSCRGWRAVLPLLGTVSTPAQPQVTTRLGLGPVGGVCDRPPHGEVDLTSFLHPAGGQQGGLSNLVGQETEARSSS